MKIIDLSQKFTNDMTKFPGSLQPEIKQIANYATDGYRVTDFHCDVHGGTHCDAPAHFVEGMKMIEDLDLKHFVGEAVIVDYDMELGREIPVSVLDGENINAGDILLFRTGMSVHWNTQEYIDNYPYLSTELAKKIVDLGVVAIGMDSLSPDAVDSGDVHNIILGAGIISIENLNNLDKITQKRFFFSAAPLLIDNAEGGLTRAYGIID